jgi:hypothetical protein
MMRIFLPEEHWDVSLLEPVGHNMSCDATTDKRMNPAILVKYIATSL